MASLELKCLGAASGNQGWLSMGGSGSAASGFISNDLHLVRTIEVFWFITTDVPSPVNNLSWRYIYSIRDTSSGSYNANADAGYYHRLYFTSADQLTWRFRDSANNHRQLSTPGFPVASGLNTWWHSVLFRSGENIGDRWYAFHGKTGVNIDGSTFTPDSWPYPYSAAGPFEPSVATLYAVRPSQAAVTRFCIGSSFTNGTGTSTSIDSRIPGGVAEFRMWSNNHGITGYFPQPDNLIDLRDQFIDGTQFPNLLHCFRLNEPAGTGAAGFDDVGSRNGSIVGSVAVGTGVGFTTHPFPPAVSGIEDLDPGAVGAQSGVSGPLGRRRYFVMPAVAMSAPAAPVPMRRSRYLAGSAAAAAAAAATMLRRRAMDPQPAAGAASAAGDLTRKVGFRGTAACVSGASAPLGRIVNLVPAPVAMVCGYGSPVELDVDSQSFFVVELSPAPIGMQSSVSSPALSRTRSVTPPTVQVQSSVSTPGLRRGRPFTGSAGGSSGASASLGRRRLIPSSVVGMQTGATASFFGGTLSATITGTETIRAELLRLEAYMSQLEIYNGALNILKSRRATTTGDSSPHVIRLSEAWELVKGRFLADVRPTEARTTVSLQRFQNTGPPASDVNPVGPYAYAYILPTDIVYPIKINGAEIVEGNISGPIGGGAGWWRKEMVPNLDVPPIKKVCLVTNESEVILEYIFRVSDSDIDILEPTSKMALTHYLAAFVVEHFGLDDSSIKRIRDEAKELMREAARISGQVGTPEMFQEDSLLWSRR